MSNLIQFQAFDFQSSAVRIITDANQEFWFCANDVCSILDYAPPRQAIQKNCKQKGVSIRDTLTNGGNQDMVYINEPNLYRLIIKSRKPEAEAFETWVFEEVLPTIRKTGSYLQKNQQIRPVIEERKYTIECTEYELRKLCWLWKMATIMAKFIGAVEKPLSLLHSKLAPAAYSFSHEYPLSIEEARKTLARATAQIQTDVIDSHDWNNVIHELRRGEINATY